MTEWVTVRHPRTGNTARVPRSALSQMPKWREVTPSAKSKSSGSKPAENSTDTSSVNSEE